MHRRSRFALVVTVVVVIVLVCAAVVVARPLENILDTDATPTWDVSMNGTGASNDIAYAVVATAGGAYVAGTAGNAAGNLDATLAWVAGGEKKWMQPWDGKAHKNDGILRLAKGPGGTLYGAGWTQNAAGKSDILLIKWSSTGSRIWTARYDGPVHGDDASMALGVDKYGNATVAGYSQGSSGSADWAIVRFDAKGAQKSVWRYDGSAHAADTPADLVMEKDGTVYVTGWVIQAGPKYAALTAKFNASGAKVWSRVSLGTSSLGAAASSIARRPAGGVYIAGWTMNAGTGADGMVMRYSSGGSGVTLPPIEGPASQVFTDVAVTTKGLIVAVGTDASSGNTDALMKTWTNETTIGPVGGAAGGVFDDGFTALATDAFNGYYFSGYDRSAADQARVFTYRLSATTGGGAFASSWGPSLGVDTTHAIAVNGTTVYIVGQTMTAGEGWNQLVLAYVY
jgi:hypothetical protein